MSFTGNVSFTEFCQGLALARRRLPKQFRLLAIAQCVGLCAMPIIAIISLPHDEELSGLLLWLPAIELGLMWLVLMLGVLNGRYQSRLMAQRLDQEFTYEIDHPAVRIVSADGESRFEWRAFVDAAEGKDVFILMQGGTLFYTLPKRIIANVDELRELIREKIPHARLQATST
jgi:YcxB-like protein